MSLSEAQRPLKVTTTSRYAVVEHGGSCNVVDCSWTSSSDITVSQVATLEYRTSSRFSSICPADRNGTRLTSSLPAPRHRQFPQTTGNTVMLYHLGHSNFRVLFRANLRIDSPPSSCFSSAALSDAYQGPTKTYLTQEPLKGVLDCNPIYGI